MKVLLIDDQRTMAADLICRNYEDGINALKSQKWDLLLLDHDLGDSYEDTDGIHRELNGYSVMCWLETNLEHLPGEVEFITANPVGRINMQRVYDKLYFNS